MKKIKCKKCGYDFRPDDSMGSDLRLCQNCWENTQDEVIDVLNEDLQKGDI